MYIDHVGINTNDMEATLRFTGHAVSPHQPHTRWAPTL
jgi:hypothetical protein